MKDVNLERASDSVVWTFALESGDMIVSKDSDFTSMSSLLGAPPKVVSIQLGNCSTREIALALRTSVDEIAEFIADPETALLIIGRSPA